MPEPRTRFAPGDVQLAGNEGGSEDGSNQIEISDDGIANTDPAEVEMTITLTNPGNGNTKTGTKTFEVDGTGDITSITGDLGDKIESAGGEAFKQIDDVDENGSTLTLDPNGQWTLETSSCDTLECQGPNGNSSDGTALSVAQGSNPKDVDPNWTGSATGGNCSRSASHFGVPWQSLGIQKSAALDGWNRQISYVVFDGDAGMTRQNGINLGLAVSVEVTNSGGTTNSNPGTEMESSSNKLEVSDLSSGATVEIDYLPNIRNWLTALPDPEDNEKAVGLRVTDGDGNFSHNPTNEDLSGNPAEGTGAAFVLISHGPNGVGAYTRNGTQITSGGSAVGTDETTNRDTAESLANASADSQDVGDREFIDRARNESDSNDHYDDAVRAMSVQELARRAGWTPLSGR